MPSVFTGGTQKPCPCGGGSGLVGLHVQEDAVDGLKSVLWEGYSGKKEVSGFGEAKQ